MTTLPLLALLLLTRLPAAAQGPASAPVQAPPLVTAEQRFSALAADYWETQMRLSPLTATFVGYGRYDDRLDDPSAFGREEGSRERERLLESLRAIDKAALNGADKISYEVLLYELERALEGDKHKFWQYGIDHMEGPQSWIPTVIATAQPMKTADDAKALLLRMKSMPAYFASYLANLREGLKDGRVAARVPVEKTAAQLEEMLKVPPEKTVYADAARKLPPNVQAVYLPRILAAVETHVNPPLDELMEFLKEDYLPKARAEKIGLWALPEGREAYRYMIRYHTTVDMTPEEIHQLGLDQLKGIRAEMEAIAKRLHHKGDLKSFLEGLRKDPKNFFATRDEVERDARSHIEATYAKLPKWFGLLPKTALVVKPFEEHREKNEVAAQYFEPSDDLSRPGIYYINTYRPETRARYNMATLAAHEGIPGHHLQIAIAMELPGLPTFRRHGDYNAFVEGWALYTERLADEMGLYPDDLSRLGMLSGQSWRACRLVVDTGLHAFGWSRQKAVDFMKDNTAMSEDEIVAEVDRYTIWPGQALAYKIGQREIMALREDAKKALGKKFDIRKFHDEVLKNGAVPLSVLRQAVKSSFTGRP
ncbi:MAG: DUF885 domain-containing protein [Elusimicrobia bacterium]|nr:DUF885 domain-containing protein [Elusimicrobiota bacterium]